MTEKFGNPWAGDGLHNIPVGGPYELEVAFSFKAERDAVVNRIRYFNAWSTEKPGYHSGTGGTIEVRLVDATAKLDHPFGCTKFPVLDFDRDVVLKKGATYSIVFRNTHPDYKAHWCSINTMAVMSQRPRVAVNSMETLIRPKGQANWTPFKPHIESVTPIFTLYNRISPQFDDQFAVPGYGGMESWVADPRQISGKKMVRQVFTPYSDFTASQISVRVAKNGKPGPLAINIYGDKQTNLYSAVVSQSMVKPVDVTTIPPSRIGHGWVTAWLAEPVKLACGVKHSIELSAPAGDAYEAFPLRDGQEVGFFPTWQNAWAEFTDDGKTWKPWEAWSFPSVKGDLQLYFS